tara:strand:- start:2388 stop:5315 length:2928 start_codon:yes stop_codon:yes gene_type:complete
MATQHNFRIKNGLEVAGTVRITSAGLVTGTTTTQAASDNTTKLASTAYVTTALANLADSAPSTLNTLNELAAALGDDANYSTTTTNAIAAKLPLAGGTLTGNLTVPYLATTSYIDLNNSGNRGKIGWSGNHTYIGTTSSVGAIIFKNNVGSTDAPQTGGDTLLTLADGGNATFTGTVTSTGLSSSSSNTGTNPAANGHIASELQFYNASATDNNLNGIGFYNSNSSVDARIAGVHKSHSSRHGEIAFLMHNGSALTERVRFDKDGNVGIGTDTPAAKLELMATRSSGANATALILHDNVTGVQTTGFGTRIEGRSNNNNAVSAIGFEAFGGTNNDTAISFYTQSTAGGLTRRMIIDDDGKVGIGVTAPDTNLEVNIQGAGDGNGIHITSTSTTNDPALKISRNNGAADVFSLRPRGGSGSAYLSIAAGTNLDSGLIMSSAGRIGLGGNTAPISTLHMYGSNTADVASNGAGINGLQLSRTSSKGENIYAYMTDGNAAASSWSGLGNVGKIESFGNNAFEIGTQQNSPVVIGQNNQQRVRIKGDVTVHARFGVTYVESLITPNGGTSPINTRIFEDHLGKWIAVGYFASDAKTSIATTFSSVTGMSTNIGQSETTAFSADWGDAKPTEVRYMGATDFENFNETKTIDFIHGVPVGRTWKHFFNNAHQVPDGGTPLGVTHMGQVMGPVGSVKYGWECRGAYDGRGRWKNPGYTHCRMSDTHATNHVLCPAAAFTTATSNAFNWHMHGDAKITAHHTLDYSGQDGNTSVAFGEDDNSHAFFDDYPNTRSNLQGSTNNYTSAVFVLMKLPEMQSIGLADGESRNHQPGEVVQTQIYERNSDQALNGSTATFATLNFTPKYGNSLLEFNIHANTGQNNASAVATYWRIYQGTPSADGSAIRSTGQQIHSGYDQATDGHPLPFSWTQYYQLNDSKKSQKTYRVIVSATGGYYWTHTYGGSAHSYFTIKEIKQNHDTRVITG